MAEEEKVLSEGCSDAATSRTAVYRAGTREFKAQVLAVLRRRYDEQRVQLAEIEPRLVEYYEDLLANSGGTAPNGTGTTAGEQGTGATGEQGTGTTGEQGTGTTGEQDTATSGAGAQEENDFHNVYELLGAVRFLRLLRTYEVNVRKVQQVVRLREGEWRRQGKVWRHVSGGIPCPGTTSPQVYRWQPFQVFVLASVFGLSGWIDTQLTLEDRDTLLPSERYNEATGAIEDLRRLCVDFTLFTPRKTDKTGMAAYIAVVFFLLEDFNAEIYCAANSSDQSKILHRRIKQMLQQLDSGDRFRITETVCDWRDGFKQVRDSSIRPLSAGGKTKDGMFAQLCCADEYGSASYTNGKSDMKRLVDVVQSSMGPRREPLTFTTTTAGRIQTGPFIEKLDSLHRLLEREMAYEDGTDTPTLSADRIMMLCLEPDLWERMDEDVMLTSHSLRRKVNPMLGRIVQHQFYDDEIAKARLDGDTGEVISKLFNVYQLSARSVEWVRPERIRLLQVERRIEDCTADDGWDIYVGMDFSQGNDLHALAYLAMRWDDEREVMEFFADMDAWINEETLRTSTIRDLYEMWIAQGWLRVSPGEVFQPNLPVRRIRELDALGLNFIGFGYDSHLSKDPINELKAWLQTIGMDADNVVVPVSQTNASFNPAVDRLTLLIKGDDLHFHFSASPLWPWEFGNVALDEDLRMGNKKPIKRNPGSDACKVDNVQCLCMCFLLEEMMV